MGGSSQAETASGPLGLTTLELAAVGVGGFLICLALMFFAVRVYGIFYKLPWTSDAETSGDKEIELERGYKYAADTHTEPTNTNEEPEVTHKRNRVFFYISIQHSIFIS